MNKEYIIITNSSTGEVFITEYDSQKFEDYVDFYEHLNEQHDLGLSESNCDCMIVRDKLIITYL